jgi:L,D-peptidoglycan transpeptidase YkuD (ErfK/YbiS/YcfS/YnhG family)
MSYKKLFVAKHTICAVIIAILLSGCTPKQILVVAPTSSIKTEMYLYENGKLTNKFSVNIGRNGIAKDGGKREGDGMTPSGEYKISSIFGYEEAKVDMPFINSKPNIICVDDIKSRYYNQIIDANTTEKDYGSFEYMRRNDEQYRYGAVIDYNHEHQASKGSCIFIHIKKDENSPTAGCIALDASDMKILFFSLKNQMNPHIFIAQDKDEFANFLKKFSLND